MNNFKTQSKKISSLEEEEIKEEKKKMEKRKFNFIPFETINYSKFDEMRKLLDDYFFQLYKSVKLNTKIEGETFKKTFFSSLENLLIQITLIKDQKLKTGKIDDVYKWFTRKWNFYLNTSKIDRKTKKTHFEKYPLPEQYKKNDNTDLYDLNNENNQHRTKIDGLESLKFK